MRNSVVPSTKVAQMASMFQAAGPAAPDTPSRKPELPPPVSARHSFPAASKQPVGKPQQQKQQKVSVHRTESHHERFSNARALFERMGSGDNLLEESSRSTSRVVSPAGSRASSVCQPGRPGSRTDSESSRQTSHPPSCDRSPSPPRSRESRSSSVSSTADPLRNGVSLATSPTKQPPDKPERKINAKEAISKQRNWFSNFEKSKSGPESVDSARRTSVKEGGTVPRLVSGGEPSSPLSPGPASPTHTAKLRSPADSIEAYMQNWKKTPSKTELW